MGLAEMIGFAQQWDTGVVSSMDRLPAALSLSPSVSVVLTAEPQDSVERWAADGRKRCQRS